MGATHFLTRTLDKVRTEMSLHVLAYNLEANDHDLRCGTADGGDQDPDRLAQAADPVSTGASTVPARTRRFAYVI